MKIAVLMVLFVSLAQVLPSCDGRPTAVIGYVEEKRVDRRTGDFIIVVNSAEYNVPSVFWQQVNVGDLVKWDGTTWTIVKKASS